MTGSGKYYYTHSTTWYDVISAVTIYNQDDIPNTTLYTHIIIFSPVETF